MRREKQSGARRRRDDDGRARARGGVTYLEAYATNVRMKIEWRA
jgi:hypothetical protein